MCIRDRDLRFEAAAASELRENTLNDEGIKVPKIYWNFTSKRILTLDKIEGVSIRDTLKIKSLNIDLKRLSENLIQLFYDFNLINYDFFIYWFRYSNDFWHFCNDAGWE